MTDKITNNSLFLGVILWLSHAFISWIVGSVNNNTYLNEIIQYLYPPLFIIVLFICFFVQRNKKTAYGIIIIGLLYYLFLWFSIIWTAGEIGCTRYFFNLFSSC